MRFLLPLFFVLYALHEYDCSAWYDKAVIYQIIPEKFVVTQKDQSILKAITSKVYYLQKLKVDVLYMTSIFETSYPNQDMGYAIDDHKKIAEKYGNLGDLKELIGVMHLAGIKVVLDLVASFTSDKCAWFEKWLNGDPDFANAYITASNPRNNWKTVYDKSVWIKTQRPTTKDYVYYLTQFLEIQPSLDLTKKEVVDAMEEIMAYWLDKGIDGFRLSHAEAYTVDQSFKNDDGRSCMTHQDASFKVLSSFKQKIDKYEERVLMTQVNSEDLNILKMYYGKDRNSDNAVIPYKNMPQLLLNSSLVKYLPSNASMAVQYKTITENFYNYLKSIDGSIVWMANAHEWPRTTAQFGSDKADAIRTIITFLYGSCSFLYGEEIGMSSSRKVSDVDWFEGKEEVQTVWGPFNWDEQKTMEDSTDPNTFKHFINILTIRNKYENLIRSGTFEPITLENDIFLFKRKYGNDILIVASNLSADQNKSIGFNVPRNILEKNHYQVLAATPKIADVYPDDSQVDLGGHILLEAGSAIVLKNL